MKKLFIAIVVTSIVANGCKKDGAHENQQAIVGNWEIRLQLGGIIPRVEYDAGNNRTYLFAGNGHFIQTYPTVSEREGTYSVTKAGTDKYTLSLNYTTFPNTTQQFSITFHTNDTLVFLPDEPCCDQAAAYYKRIPMPD